MSSKSYRRQLAKRLDEGSDDDEDGGLMPRSRPFVKPKVQAGRKRRKTLAERVTGDPLYEALVQGATKRAKPAFDLFYIDDKSGRRKGKVPAAARATVVDSTLAGPGRRGIRWADPLAVAEASEDPYVQQEARVNPKNTSALKDVIDLTLGNSGLSVTSQWLAAQQAANARTQNVIRQSSASSRAVTQDAATAIRRIVTPLDDELTRMHEQMGVPVPEDIPMTMEDLDATAAVASDGMAMRVSDELPSSSTFVNVSDNEVIELDGDGGLQDAGEDQNTVAFPDEGNVNVIVRFSDGVEQVTVNDILNPDSLRKMGYQSARQYIDTPLTIAELYPDIPDAYEPGCMIVARRIIGLVRQLIDTDIDFEPSEEMIASAATKDMEEITDIFRAVFTKMSLYTEAASVLATYLEGFDWTPHLADAAGQILETVRDPGIQKTEAMFQHMHEALREGRYQEMRNLQGLCDGFLVMFDHAIDMPTKPPGADWTFNMTSIDNPAGRVPFPQALDTFQERTISRQGAVTPILMYLDLQVSLNRIQTLLSTDPGAGDVNQDAINAVRNTGAMGTGNTGVPNMPVPPPTNYSPTDAQPQDTQYMGDLPPMRLPREDGTLSNSSTFMTEVDTADDVPLDVSDITATETERDYGTELHEQRQQDAAPSGLAAQEEIAGRDEAPAPTTVRPSTVDSRAPTEPEVPPPAPIPTDPAAHAHSARPPLHPSQRDDSPSDAQRQDTEYDLAARAPSPRRNPPRAARGPSPSGSTGPSPVLGTKPTTEAESQLRDDTVAISRRPIMANVGPRRSPRLSASPSPTPDTPAASAAASATTISTDPKSYSHSLDRIDAEKALAAGFTYNMEGKFWEQDGERIGLAYMKETFPRNTVRRTKTNPGVTAQDIINENFALVLRKYQESVAAGKDDVPAAAEPAGKGLESMSRNASDPARVLVPGSGDPYSVLVQPRTTHSVQGMLDYQADTNTAAGLFSTYDHTTRGQQTNRARMEGPVGSQIAVYPQKFHSEAAHAARISSNIQRPFMSRDLEVLALSGQPTTSKHEVDVVRARVNTLSRVNGFDRILAYRAVASSSNIFTETELEHVYNMLQTHGVENCKSMQSTDPLLHRLFQAVDGKGFTSSEKSLLGGRADIQAAAFSAERMAKTQTRLYNTFLGSESTAAEARMRQVVAQRSARETQIAVDEDFAQKKKAALDAMRQAARAQEVQSTSNYLTSSILAGAQLVTLTGVAQGQTVNEQIPPELPALRSAAAETLRQQAEGEDRAREVAATALSSLPGYFAEYARIAQARRTRGYM